MIKLDNGEENVNVVMTMKMLVYNLIIIVIRYIILTIRKYLLIIGYIFSQQTVTLLVIISPSWVKPLELRKKLTPFTMHIH